MQSLKLHTERKGSVELEQQHGKAEVDIRRIIYPVGIKGDFYIAEALKEEFGAELVGISLSRSYHRQLNARTDLFDRHFSFFEFLTEQEKFGRLPTRTEFHEEIAVLEDKLGIGSSVRLAYMDRNLAKVREPDRFFELIWAYLAFLDRIFEEAPPGLAKGSLTSYLGLVLNEACAQRGIPCLKQQTGRLGTRTEFANERNLGTLRGWHTVYEKFSAAPEQVPQPLLDEARETVTRFREKPLRPKYAEANSVDRFDLWRPFQLIAKDLGKKASLTYWHDRFGSAFDRRLGYKDPFGKQFFENYIQRELRGNIQRINGTFSKRPRLKKPFIYAPLQREPELTTLTYNPVHREQDAWVAHMARNLPSGYMLYVKEHTSMLGRRPAWFYRRILTLPNVELVHPSVSTFDLMASCSAVSVLNSTAGWEAFLLKKPVVVWSKAFFQEFPGVLHGGMEENFASELEDYVAGFQQSDNTVELAVAAYLAVTYPVTTGDIGDCISPDEARDNARRLAACFRDQVECFS